MPERHLLRSVVRPEFLVVQNLPGLVKADSGTRRHSPPPIFPQSPAILSRFTSETARSMALRSHEVRRMRAQCAKDAENRKAQEAQDSGIPPLAFKLMRAQEEKLDELLQCRDARDCASLAQALRHLRETYHLVTGLARPGVSKPGSTGRRVGKSWEPMPDTTGSVPPANPETTSERITPDSGASGCPPTKPN